MSVDPSKHLAPPLRLAWVAENVAPHAPLVSAAHAFFFTRGADCLCLDVVSGMLIWRYSIKGFFCAPELVVGDRVYVALRGRGTDQSRDGYHVIDIASGERRSSMACTPRSGVVFFEGLIVGADAAIEAIDAKSGATVWVRPEAGLGLFPYYFTHIEDRLVFGRENGDVVCIATRTGKQLWKTTVKELVWDAPHDPKPGVVHGPIFGCSDRLVVNVSRHHLVCLSLKSGRRLWHHEGFVSEGCLSDKKLVTRLNQIFDLETGKQLPWPDRQTAIPLRLDKKFLLKGRPIVSSTHRFDATWSGYLSGWDLRTGDVTWIARPEFAIGALDTGETFAIRNGRLYYADSNWSVYCFEEEAPTDPVLARQRAPAGRARRKTERLLTVRPVKIEKE
mgnify:CR=1 FL=1